MIELEQTRELLTQIALLYHDQGITQEEISRRFGLSRAKVGRLLKQAREEGVVEVRIHHHPQLSARLEKELIERFAIRRALIALNHEDPNLQRGSVAALVSAHLSEILGHSMVVAVGMGRNIGAIPDAPVTVPARDLTFVCATGGASQAGEPWNADHICRRLAARFGGRAETMYAPAYVNDPVLRQGLMNNDTVRRTFNTARRADIALIGIGDLGEDSHMVRMGWFTPAEIVETRESGVVGDLMGYDFFDINGQPANERLGGRVIGLTKADLERIPNVIAVAAENSKAVPLLGALRSGAIDTLATSLSNVNAILALDRAARP